MRTVRVPLQKPFPAVTEIPHDRRQPVNRDVLRFGAPIAYVLLIFVGFAISPLTGIILTVLGAVGLGLLYTFANPGSPFERPGRS